MLRYNNHILAWVAEWYTRESQKLVAVMALRVRVSPQAHELLYCKRIARN